MKKSTKIIIEWIFIIDGLTLQSALLTVIEVMYDFNLQTSFV
jgi:hypothetical protein